MLFFLKPYFSRPKLFLQKLIFGLKTRVLGKKASGVGGGNKKSILQPIAWEKYMSGVA